MKSRVTNLNEKLRSSVRKNSKKNSIINNSNTSSFNRDMSIVSNSNVFETESVFKTIRKAKEGSMAIMVSDAASDSNTNNED